MTETATQATQTLERMLHAAAAELSPSAVNALVAHPDAVRAALAATGELLARNGTGSLEHDKVETSSRPGEVAGIVEARTTPYEPEEEVLNSKEVAARLGLKSRQSVHDWLRKGRILGWQTAKRGYVFPVRQFDESNRPIAGLGTVVALFGDAYRAWYWLTTPLNLLEDQEPLALLSSGERESVIEAAEADLQGDFG